MDKLYGEHDFQYKDTDRKMGMNWVQKFLRMKHVIVFKISHDVLQVRVLLFSLHPTLTDK